MSDSLGPGFSVSNNDAVKLSEGELNSEDSAAIADIPDAFQRLWTPHRMVYINRDENAYRKAKDCPFCVSPTRDDETGLVVYRGEFCFVVLNLYPYSPGHLLVCPYRHIAYYYEISKAETAELADLTQRAMQTLTKVSKPAGFNIGMNQGQIAGAGIAQHLHQHVVPRWLGDSNFMPIIGQTRALPQLLGETRELLAKNWV